MYQLNTTKQFTKDYKLCKKRGLNIVLLNAIFTQLHESGKIHVQFKPHKLRGNYAGFWECHIQSVWLLIWLQDYKNKIIELTRTGTHSDLF
jgi:mRNA interferase YafQ